MLSYFYERSLGVNSSDATTKKPEVLRVSITSTFRKLEASSPFLNIKR